MEIAKDELNQELADQSPDASLSRDLEHFQEVELLLTTRYEFLLKLDYPPAILHQLLKPVNSIKLFNSRIVRLPQCLLPLTTRNVPARQSHNQTCSRLLIQDQRLSTNCGQYQGPPFCPPSLFSLVL